MKFWNILNSSVCLSVCLQVSDVEEFFTVEVTVVTQWQDPRLTFLNLQDNFSLNQLSAEEKVRIWLPKYHFLNTHSDPVELLHETVYVERTENVSTSDFNALTMGNNITHCYILLS